MGARAVGPALILTIGLSACSGSTTHYTVNEKKIETVVNEVMQDQNPKKRQPRMSATLLDEYESTMMEYLEEKSPLKINMLHRLGDLYLKIEDRAYKERLQAYNQQLRQFQQKRIAQKPTPPKIDHARSIKIYTMLLSQYPNYPKNDQVLYQLARANDDIGKPDEAVAHLKRLVERFPTSPLATESFFRIGEYHYHSGEFPEAIKAYGRVLQSREPSLEEQTLYKMGWAYFGQQDYRNAIGEFVLLLDRKRVKREDGTATLDPKVMSTAEWDFVLEVIRSIAFSFSYLGGSKTTGGFEPDSVRNYFEQTAHRDYEPLIYMKLGELFQTQNRVRDEVAVYETFLKYYPQNPQAPQFAMEVITAYTRLGVVDLANKARIRFVDQFGPDTEWYRLTSPENREKFRPTIKKLMNQLALFYHHEAQQTQRSKDYEKAITWYRRFIQAFPKEVESANINFLLAESLYDFQRYAEAAEEYERTAYGYFFHQDSLKAGYSAVVSYDKAMGNRKDLKAHPLVPKLGQACRRFAEGFPDDPRVAEVLWRGAEVYYAAGETQESRALSEMIVKRYLQTRHPLAFKAQRLIADLYFESRSYEEAAQAYRQIFTNAPDLKEKERDNLKKLWGSALYKQAEAIRDSGKTEEAEAGFLRVQREVPGSDVAPVALFDAGTLALKRGAVDSAIQVFQVLEQQYATHKLAAKVADLILQTQQRLLTDGKQQEAEDLARKIPSLKTPSQDSLAYQSQRLIADKQFETRAYDKAAESYRQLLVSATAKSGADRSEIQRLLATALYKHAEQLKAAGKAAEAEAGFLRVQQEAPDGETAPIALFDAGGMAMERKDLNAALQTYQLLIQKYPYSEYVSHAAVRVAQIYEQQGQASQAARMYERIPQLTQDRRLAGDALWTAAILYEKTGDWTHTAEAYQNYADQFSGNYERTVEARFKVIQAMQAMGQQSQVQPLVQRFLDTYGQGEIGQSRVGAYVAKAYLLKADQMRQQYEQVKLVSPMEENLAKKRALMNQVLEVYLQVSEVKTAELLTDATYKIGLVFENFRNALLDSERPSNLTPQQLEQYDFLLEEQAYPFEEQAISAYETNVRRAQEASVYNVWVKRSYEELARLKPARYKKL